MSSRHILEELQEWRNEARAVRRELDSVTELLEDLLLILESRDIVTAEAILKRALKEWTSK